MTEFGAAASSSSSSFTYGWSYHVFLSFRGEDTRQGFTGHLYNALHKRGIRTFLDDEGIRKGEDITPTLLKAIEESKTAIVVFSKNYASSTFCLTELVQILNCMKGRNGRFIWPVFYDVDPSDIRHQTGSYKDAFDRHERVKDEKIVKDWRLALTEAANMSGWHFELEPRSKSYEYEMMEEIIGVVSKEISTGPLHIVQFSVGLESRVKEVCSLLNKQPHFDGATMVGICGIGGIGKTTIVRAVYNTIAGQFQYSCFLSNIKEKSIQDLQEILLSETIGEKDIKLNYDKRGIPIIKDRLQNKKVLLILDDIDTLDQLRALAGESNWFGFGSTIIITTRDRSLLKNHEVERLYEVKELTCEEARQLLILNAFKNKEANPGYAKVIQRAVEYASGLPLVLEILGSNFHICRTIEEWETALDIYEKIPDKTVQKILKVSYDGLGEKQREIFLDIACFYRGQPLEDATKILSASHDIGVEFCIRELIEKSLIKIDDDSYLDMHDLIQDMGQEIVRQESPIDVGRRSRLWSSKDILHVLKENTGTATIQAMNLLFNFKGKEVEWSGEAFEKMKNLRLLSFCRGVMFSQGPKCLPNSLRVVQWDHYPSSTLPDDFCPINLVILRLRYSHLKTLGKAFKNCCNLRELDLSYNKNLEEFPDISEAVNLEVLDVSYCKKLTKIDDSVGHFAKLRILNAKKCINLDTFIVKGIKLVSLEILNLSNCSNLHIFPEILVTMEKIETLDLSYTAIKILPESIEKLIALETLCLSDSTELRQLPNLACCNLKRLDLNGCKKLEEIKGISQDIEVFSAKNCTSLTSCTTRLLLRQELQETGKTEFVMPGNEIPKWLHKHSTGGSVSFLVRRKFPQIALCAVVTGGPTIFSSFVMHINGVTKYVVRREKIEIEIDHIFLFDLRRFKRKVASPLEALWKHTRVLRIDDVASKLLAKEWDHVKFSLESEGTESRLKYIGVYVYNYDSCKEDILFENPIPQERIQVEAVHKIGDSNLASSSRDNNEEETVSDVEKKKGQLKMDNVNLTLSLALPEPSSDTTSHYDLQQQQQLTCINQQTSESFEIVGKAKGKGIIVHVGDANEEKDKNAFEVTYQNALRSSNGSLTLDPMIGKYGSTRQKDQSTIIDEGHDGCDPMEWEYQFTHPKDESIIIGKDDKLNKVMDSSLKAVSRIKKKKRKLKVDNVNLILSSALPVPSSDTTTCHDLQLQQQLTSINQQISESSEIVKEAKGKDIMVHGGNADEIKDKNAFEVTCQNWDPMIWQYGSTRKKDQSTIIDEGHDGCDRMEWEYQFTPWKDQSTIIDEGHDGCGPMEWESQFTHPKDQSTIIADKLDKEIMDLSTKTVSNIEKKGQLMVDDVNLTLSLALPEPSNDTTSHHDLQQQQDLSCINHEILDCSENVQKGGNIFEVSWDAVEIHGESTIIDEGHDGRGSPYSKDLQQQQQLTSINQQTSESFDVVEKAKGKGIIVHGGNANEEKDKNALEKDQSTINDKGLDELGSHKARATCFDLLCCLVSLCSSSAAS